MGETTREACVRAEPSRWEGEGIRARLPLSSCERKSLRATNRPEGNPSSRVKQGGTRRERTMEECERERGMERRGNEAGGSNKTHSPKGLKL